MPQPKPRERGATTSDTLASSGTLGTSDTLASSDTAAAATRTRRQRSRGAKRHRRRPFALVLAGGGARGAAHIGVLRALEHLGHPPAAVVGVSMGAIVGATYALNPNWYHVLVHLDRERIPSVFGGDPEHPIARLRKMVESGRALRHLLLRWGTLTAAEPAIRELLAEYTLGQAIEAARIPFAAVATDLASGNRHVMTQGNAADAIYASGALAGILPPARSGDALLADGAYVDVAPIDVARELGGDLVVAVDASQRLVAAPPRNALQALSRAMEIGFGQQAKTRMREADLVIRPDYPCPVTTLDFRHHRRCVAAGARGTLQRRRQLRALLDTGAQRETARALRLADGAPVELEAG